MRPGPARDPKGGRPAHPNTGKMMAQLIKVARLRGCNLEYLQSLLKEEWDKALRHDGKTLSIVPAEASPKQD